MAKAKTKKKSSRKSSGRNGIFSSISIMSILVGLGIALLLLIGINVKHYLNQSKNISGGSSSEEILIPTPTYAPNTGY